MKTKIYVCGDSCFISSDQQGLWHKTDRCVAFVVCPDCEVDVGELCTNPSSKLSRQTHWKRRHLYSKTQEGKNRNKDVTAITVEEFNKWRANITQADKCDHPAGCNKKATIKGHIAGIRSNFCAEHASQYSLLRDPDDEIEHEEEQ